MKNIHNEAILECSKCRNRFKDKIWTQIKIGENNITDCDLFMENINYFECETCENTGFACYPITITDKDCRTKSMLIPSRDAAFFVTKVIEEKPCRIFYDFDSLKWQIYSWERGNALFNTPLTEDDIKESIEKGTISEKEGEILKKANLIALFDDIAGEVEFEISQDKEEEEILDIYLRTVKALKSSRAG